ncbi:hypothetical protein [Flavobacterium sp.]|uniref:hypothetical protein n=1 Tax=Flavobacterium sp. TaxID=239 RepID=UPI0025C0C97A|nr:hypothetical protein [Flavobacterium sp.]MBA4154147.1 hypothetical protein [Flavobacterium sp.]
MYYKTDEQGNYLGVKSETNEGMEFFSTTPLPTDIAKVRNVGGVWVNAETEEEILSTREVPQLVPLWCIKVILHEMGLLATVEMELSKLPEPMKTRASYIWEYGNQIDRKSQTVAFIGAVLQKDKTEIDTIFINANNIEL